MTKPLKIVVITAITLFVISIIGYFMAQAMVVSKLERFIENDLPESLSISYHSIDVSVWDGSVIMVNPKIINRGRHSAKNNAEMELDTLLVDGFGFFNYFKNDHIHVESVQLRSPKMLYNHDSAIPKNEYRYSALEQLKKEIKIGRFNVQNGELHIKDIATDSLLLYTTNVTANVMDIRLNSNTVKRRIPFNYANYNLSYNDLHYKIGDYEDLKLSSAVITQDKATFKTIHLYTKYSKIKLNQMIAVERDHFDVRIPSLTLEAQNFGYKNDSIFYFKSPKVTFDSPEMHLYRNKLVADDYTQKELYSKALRELAFELTLSNVILRNATIVYSEKVNADMEAGKIAFTKMNANIKNISNTYKSPEKTSLNIDAVFMARTPLKVDWQFDVNDVNDVFVFKVDIGKLPAPDLNPFSQPNLKVRFEGELLKTYATISGDVNTSRVDMKVNYEDFKVVVLDKEGKKKKKILSAIANLFIKKDSDAEHDGFREGFKEGIARDHTKSIFNFLWLSVRSGLVSVLTGDGKK
ncbi:hypothetical protein BXY82_2436 [Gelidibacter sediminis]|uniref:DUF748 domain-containing protein n=1 Tax=Gelidibacter sediminis TaxID=1608710 RepID=A0A4R7Q1A1_9FLAO|nr:hypothetical protein [Gelidibacter sediminis]TDU40389.1 hypothetical protein BXY82_2436 [Gelidibacter sediminis]